MLAERVYYDCTRRARGMMKRFDGLKGPQVTNQEVMNDQIL